MPRFVVLRHELSSEAERASHWDLMFESGGVLCTWALASEPDSTSPTDAEQLADHRLAYLDYEGPVSGARGSVTRWDWGDCELIEQSELRWRVHVQGRRLSGVFVIERAQPAGHSWRVSFGADPTSG